MSDQSKLRGILEILRDELAFKYVRSDECEILDTYVAHADSFKAGFDAGYKARGEEVGTWKSRSKINGKRAFELMDANQKLREALEKIKPGYGLDVTDSDVQRADYWAGIATSFMCIAREALKDTCSDGEKR